MQLKGRILGFAYDYSLKEWVVSFGVKASGQTLQDLFTELREKVVDLTVKCHREKRSLNANAYYWEIVGKCADKMHVSNGYMHNTLLQKCAALKTYDGNSIEIEIVEDDSTYDRVMEDTCTHLKPLDYQTPKDGKKVRTYQLLKGSSEMDSKEFSRLVDMALDKAKSLNIPTISDEECERMLKAYGKKRIQ